MNQNPKDKIELHSERIERSTRFIVWLCFVLVVLTAGTLARSFITQGRLDKLDDVIYRTEAAVSQTYDVSENAKTAAESALKELRAAIRAIEESGSDQVPLNNQAINEALIAIARLENYLCNGRCPDVGD
jgi:hypothetical protein